MSAAASSALSSAESDVHVRVWILPFLPGGDAGESLATAAAPAPAEGDAAVWEGALTLAVPAGTRRPASSRFEIRRGEAVLAAGDLLLNAPYAPSPDEAVRSEVTVRMELGGGDVGAAVELRLSYALALASGTPAGSGADYATAETAGGAAGGCGAKSRAGGEEGESPVPAPQIRAVAGRSLPPLALRCLRGKKVKIEPSNCTQSSETQTVQQESKSELRLYPAHEMGRTLSFALATKDPAEPQAWHLGTVLSGTRGSAVARLVAPADAPVGSLQLLVSDTTTTEVRHRLGLVPLGQVVVEVHMSANPAVGAA